MNIHNFKQRKLSQQKISMVTCYDYNSAQIVSDSNIDCVLIGDTVAMLMHGYPNTLGATVEMLATHTQAVARAAANKWLTADLPFCSYRKSITNTVQAAETLMRAGANAVKLEGAKGNLDTIKHLVDSGIPVMGHLGLTPQSVHNLGGFKVQGKEKSQAEKIVLEAEQLEQAGCFALVLECIPATVAATITDRLTIPTIGIGAGANTDGQVLVWQDLLGLNPHFNAKFYKTYTNGHQHFLTALNNYHQEVKSQQFPDPQKHCFE